MKHISLTPFVDSRQPRVRAFSLSFRALVRGKWGEVKHLQISTNSCWVRGTRGGWELGKHGKNGRE